MTETLEIALRHTIRRLKHDHQNYNRFVIDATIRYLEWLCASQDAPDAQYNELRAILIAASSGFMIAYASAIDGQANVITDGTPQDDEVDNWGPYLATRVALRNLNLTDQDEVLVKTYATHLMQISKTQTDNIYPAFYYGTLSYAHGLTEAHKTEANDIEYKSIAEDYEANVLLQLRQIYSRLAAKDAMWQYKELIDAIPNNTDPSARRTFEQTLEYEAARATEMTLVANYATITGSIELGYDTLTPAYDYARGYVCGVIETLVPNAVIEDNIDEVTQQSIANVREIVVGIADEQLAMTAEIARKDNPTISKTTLTDYVTSDIITTFVLNEQPIPDPNDDYWTMIPRGYCDGIFDASEVRPDARQ